MAISKKLYIRPGQVIAQRGIARHAFTVGEKVKVLPNAFGRKSKEVERSLYGADFEIMRLMPEEASSFHYRIKNVVTGQERVASESELRAASEYAG